MKKTKTPIDFEKIRGVQPLSFNKETFSPNKKYYTTYYSSNSERNFLIIRKRSPESIVLNQKMRVYDFELPKKPELTNTVMDCEMFNQKLYAFDILFYKGKDVRDLNFTERLDILKSTLKDINSKRISLKKYNSPYENTLCNNFYNVIDTYKKNTKLSDRVDGVIFKPDEKYSSHPLRYKPTEITTNFKIKKLDNNVIGLLSRNNRIFSKKDNKNIGYVKVSEKKYNFYKNGDVVEFAFKNNQFIPQRRRIDKNISDSSKIIKSNFETILNPPDMRKLLSC